MKKFEIYRNGTHHGDVWADSIESAEEQVFATYGRALEVVEAEEDLFEKYDEMPEDLRKICDHYFELMNSGEYGYGESEAFLIEVEAIGYTFDYGLDNDPYELRKIN